MVLNSVLTYMIYLYIFLLPILPSKFCVYSIPFNGDVLLLIIIGIYCINIVFVRNSRLRFINGLRSFFTDYFSLSILLCVSVMFLSTIFSTNKAIAIKESIRFSTYIILFFVIKNEIYEKNKLLNIIKVYITTTVVVSLIGLYQALNGVGMLQAGQFGKMVRVESTLENPNNLGVFLIISIFPILLLFIREKHKIKKIIYASVVLLSIVTVIMTFSRNSWLGLLFGCIMLVMLVNYKFIISLIIIPIAAFLVPQIKHRIPDYLNSGQNMERLKFWKLSLKMFVDSPLKGVGNGNFPTLYEKYRRIYPEFTSAETVIHPHNGYLKILSELGLFGAIPFLLSIFFQIKNIRAFTKKSIDWFFNSFFSGFLVSYLTFVFMNLFDNFLSAPKVFTFIWILYAISQSEALTKKSSNLL